MRVEMAGSADEGAEEGAGLEASREDVRAEDEMREGLVFGLRRRRDEGGRRRRGRTWLLSQSGMKLRWWHVVPLRKKEGQMF